MPTRKDVRLSEYDYSSQGCYFITICTKDKVQYLGRIRETICDDDHNRRIVCDVVYSKVGCIAKEELINIPIHFSFVRIDSYVIMPDHIHILIELSEHLDHSIRRPSLSNIIGLYKSGVSRICRQKELYIAWQRNFHEHIIHSDAEKHQIREYIQSNPNAWREDYH